jgi:hypothetical protein
MIKMPNAMRAVQMNAAAPSAHAANFHVRPASLPATYDRFAGSILSENVDFSFGMVPALSLCNSTDMLFDVSGCYGHQGLCWPKGCVCVCVCVLTGRITTPPWRVCRRQLQKPECFSRNFFLPPAGRGNVPRPLSLNDQILSRMRFTLVASSFLRLNSEAKASAILRRFFRRPARHFAAMSP